MKAKNLLKIVEQEHGKPIRSTQIKSLIVVLAKLLPTIADAEGITHHVTTNNSANVGTEKES